MSRLLVEIVFVVMSFKENFLFLQNKFKYTFKTHLILGVFVLIDKTLKSSSFVEFIFTTYFLNINAKHIVCVFTR